MLKRAGILAALAVLALVAVWLASDPEPAGPSRGAAIVDPPTAESVEPHDAGPAVPLETWISEAGREHLPVPAAEPRPAPALEIVARVRRGPRDVALRAMPLREWAEAPGPGEMRVSEGKSLKAVESEAIPGAETEAGVWSFNPQDPGAFTIGTEAHGWRVHPEPLIRLEDGQKVEVTVDIVAGGAIHVRAVDSGGAPLAGVNVHLFSTHSPETAQPSRHHATQRTPEAGTASFHRLDPEGVFDVIAGGKFGFHTAVATGVVPGPETISMELRAYQDRSVRVLDLVEGSPIPGANVFAMDKALVQYTGRTGGAGLESVGCTGFAAMTDEDGFCTVKDFQDPHLDVLAEGYAHRSLIAPGERTPVVVRMTPTGWIAGQVVDRLAQPVPQAQILYRLRKNRRTIEEGEEQTDIDGLYYIEIQASDRRELLDGEASMSVEITATHPEAGHAHLRALVPANDTHTSRFDLVLVPNRELRVHLQPGAVWPGGGRITAAVSRERRLVPMLEWVEYDSRLLRAPIDENGLAVFEDIPEEGLAWFAVAAARGKGGTLAIVGPVDLATLDEEWWLRLPTQDELGAVSVTIREPGTHELTLYPYRDNAWALPVQHVAAATYRVEGGVAAAVPWLFPEDYFVTIDGKYIEGLTTLTVRPGAVYALGALRATSDGWARADD